MAAGDPTAVRASGLRPGAYALAVFAAGALLVLLAVPQFMAALARVGGDTALVAVGVGQEITPRQIERGLRSRTAAARWWPTHRDMADIALLRLLQAQTMDLSSQSGQRRLLLDRAAAAAQSGLALNAGDSYLWMRLAEARFLRGGLDDDVAPALVQSMERGPTIQAMIMPRLELAFLLDRLLTDAQHATVDRQIQLAALWHADRLAVHARRRFALGIVRRALAQTPDRLERFDAAWEASR